MEQNSNKEYERQLVHHQFVKTTDRKSLFTQIKGLVARAQDIANKELKERREALHKLLEYEDTIYEEEFANKVKSRIDEDIKERNNALLKIKEQSARNEQEFLQSKRIQQYMESCYEIREALRYKERQNVKECQLEQMLEKERAIKRQRDLDKYWLKVQQLNLDIADSKQKEEDCLKKSMAKYVTDTLDIQMEEREAKREELRQETLEDKKNLDALLEEIRLEEFDLKKQGFPTKTLQYRKELLDMMAEKKALRDKIRMEEAKEHLDMIAEMKRLDEEEDRIIRERKKAFYNATMDYIGYVKRMKQLKDYQENMYSNRIDDLRRVDICTKENLKLEMERKAKIAQECYSVLRKQICEQYERRLLDRAEQRECKILENLFVHDDITREEILEQRRKNRIGLDNQIAEMKRVREEEELKFSQNLLKASNDPLFCDELAKEYMAAGIDYLDPHPNWRILACPTKTYIPKPPAKDITELPGGSSGAESSQTCIKPCGCEVVGKFNCPPYKRDGRGDEDSQIYCPSHKVDGSGDKASQK